MLLRDYKPSDYNCLAELFYQTVHCINAKNYTEEQLNAWATGKVDIQEWDSSFPQFVMNWSVRLAILELPRTHLLRQNLFLKVVGTR